MCTEMTISWLSDNGIGLRVAVTFTQSQGCLRTHSTRSLDWEFIVRTSIMSKSISHCLTCSSIKIGSIVLFLSIPSPSNYFYPLYKVTVFFPREAPPGSPIHVEAAPPIFCLSDACISRGMNGSSMNLSQIDACRRKNRSPPTPALVPAASIRKNTVNATHSIDRFSLIKS